MSVFDPTNKLKGNVQNSIEILFLSVIHHHQNIPQVKRNGNYSSIK